MTVHGQSQVFRKAAGTPGTSGVLRYATAQTWALTTVGAQDFIAPFGITDSPSFVDDPDGVFSAHPNVMTIPASWTVETGAAVCIVTFGIMVQLDDPPSATNGAVNAQLWVFSSFGSVSHESIAAQAIAGYRDLVDAQWAVYDTSLMGSVQLDALSAGMVIELDLLNGVEGSDLRVNQGILGAGFFSPCYLGIVKVGNG